MKKLLLFIFLFSFTTAIYAQTPKYLQVKIKFNNQVLNTMASLGIPLEGAFQNHEYLITELPENDLNQLKAQNINYEVLIEDVTKFYIERNKKFKNYKINREKGEYPVPDGWELGTMGGMYTFDQIIAELDTMRNLYPELITIKQTLDYNSIEGRPIYYVKISDNANQNEDEPEVLYTGLHHAREGISAQLLIYYMYYLLENYETDQDVQYVVNSTEMFFIPCLNPDGYVYNETTYPNGGGMWRKNRRNNGNGSYGVDLNRNYAYKWGYDDNGSSPNPWDETYRGTEAFSEPETQAISDFCIAHNFKMALNYHSYSNLLLYTWGYIDDPCPDDATLEAYAAEMTQENQYTYGPGATTIYPSNGGSDDWMYGEYFTKNRFFSYTPEVGSSNDGFWPAIDRIVPLCQENMLQNIMAAKFASNYGFLRDEMPGILRETEGYLEFSLKRMGQTNGDFIVSIEPISDLIQSIGDSVTISDLNVFEQTFDSIAYELVSDIQQGQELSYVLKLDNGEVVYNDTITKIYGQPYNIFVDEGNDIENWNGGWDITTEDFVSPESCITDSPYENYANSDINLLVLKEPIDLSNISYAELTFQAKWDIENNRDYVQLMISTNNGTTWKALKGRYTNPGTENQVLNQPVYDDVQEDWVKEYFNLSNYIGKSVIICFYFRSDNYVRQDGYYFDDLKFAVLDIYTDMEDNLSSGSKILYEPYPNPAKEFVRFEINKPLKQDHELVVYNTQGKLVKHTTVKSKKKFIYINVGGWSPGVYIYRFTGNENQSGRIIIH